MSPPPFSTPPCTRIRPVSSLDPPFTHTYAVITVEKKACCCFSLHGKARLRSSHKHDFRGAACSCRTPPPSSLCSCTCCYLCLYFIYA